MPQYIVQYHFCIYFDKKTDLDVIWYSRKKSLY